MVGLLSQMEGSDHSMVPSFEHSTVAEEPTAALIDSSRAAEGDDGLIVKETCPAETCPETEPSKDGSEIDTAKTDDPSNLDNAHEEKEDVKELMLQGAEDVKELMLQGEEVVKELLLQGEEDVKELLLQGEEDVKELKSILKRRGQYTMRKVKVDFDLVPKRIPYDETKDYTVEIQIVDKEPVKIKSWAAVFAAQKAEAEAEEAAAAEAEAALKKAEEVRRRAMAKLLKKGVDIGSVKGELPLLKEIKTKNPLEDQKLTEDQQRNPEEDSNENKLEKGLTNQGDATILPAGDPEENSRTKKNPNGEPNVLVANSLDGAKNQSNPVHDGVPELNQNASEDRINSAEVCLLRDGLPEDIAKVATNIVEEILAEAPVQIKVICLNEGSDRASVDEDRAVSMMGCYRNAEISFGDLQNEDRTGSTIEEYKNIRSDSVKHGNETANECTEEMPRDALCSKQQEAVNDKVSDVVISNKLNESLKKATPEIVDTAVRVLVDVEKVTLAVVTNLDAIVP